MVILYRLILTLEMKTEILSIHGLATIGILSLLFSVAIGGVSTVSYAQDVPVTSNATDLASVLVQEEGSVASRPLEPPANGTFVRNGQVSSSPSILPTNEGVQTAVILEPRQENTVYSGMVTFESSRPVSLVSWQIISDINGTLLTEEFGDFDDVLIGGRGVLVPAEIASGTSGSAPFVGNAIALVSEDDDDDANEPFLATYSVQGTSGQPTIQNELASLINSSSADSSPVPSEDTEDEE